MRHLDYFIPFENVVLVREWRSVIMPTLERWALP